MITATWVPCYPRNPVLESNLSWNSVTLSIYKATQSRITMVVIGDLTLVWDDADNLRSRSLLHSTGNIP